MSLRSAKSAVCLVMLMLLVMEAGWFPCFGVASETRPDRILVVMSYEAGNSWVLSEREGIDDALAGYEVRYFYLDTKRDEKGGWEKGREAKGLLDEFAPDVVIAADDSAQEMFVVPFLKGKSSLPVVFCGVNDDAAKYGYPAANVTGVVEVKHYLQTISFGQLLVKDMRRVAVIYRESQSNAVNVAQIRREMGSYPVEVTEILSVASLSEARAVMKKFKGQVEAFLVLNLSGIIGDDGVALDGPKAIGELRKLGVAMLATDDSSVVAGALGGVIQSGRAQGFKAGQMVRLILAGQEPGQIPLERNLNGQRYINLTTARQLGLEPGPEAVLGSKLLR